MNRIQFNAVMLICSVILYSNKPTAYMMAITMIILIFYAESYFSQKEDDK